MLQHLPTVEVIRRFIAEFLRVLRTDGLLAFQLTTRMPPRTLRNKLRLRTRVYAALRAAAFDQRLLYERLNLVPVMEYRASQRKASLPICACSGAAVVEVQHARFAIGDVESATYFVAKSNGR